MKVKRTGKSTHAQEKRMHTLGRNNTNYGKLFWKKNVIQPLFFGCLSETNNSIFVLWDINNSYDTYIPNG
jgi:hypothetical protein